jgi:hypothetical protein
MEAVDDQVPCVGAYVKMNVNIFSIKFARLVDINIDSMVAV